MEMSVSVIIPAFNRAHLIGETLESIIDQSLPPAEIIVVDDGSTDETAAVVARYRRKVRYVKIPNSGVCRARNTGAALACGEWLAFCDSDDLWARDKLARQAALFRCSPGTEYCFTNFRFVRNGRWSEETKFEAVPPGYWDLPRRQVTPVGFVVTEPLYPRLIRFQPVFPSTVMMSRSFFERIGRFDEAFGRKMSEDFEFTLRCGQESPSGVITEPVVGIRRHGQNFSRGPLPGISFVLGDMEILEHSLKHHRLGPQYEELITESIIGRGIAVANGAFERGDFELLERVLRGIPLPRRSLKLRLKAAIGRLPLPVSQLIQQGMKREDTQSGGADETSGGKVPA
jgi:glycosyltransferase involved in cell wall biosynthesis